MGRDRMELLLKENPSISSHPVYLLEGGIQNQNRDCPVLTGQCPVLQARVRDFRKNPVSTGQAPSRGSCSSLISSGSQRQAYSLETASILHLRE